MQDVAVSANKLVIIKGDTRALDAVSFEIPKGKITGLIGPSGSGKTTLMRAIVGAQMVTSGELFVLGLPAGSRDLRTKLGYVTQVPAIYDDLTTWQNLHYFAAMLGLGEPAVRQVLAAVNLESRARQLVGSMSGGERARVSLAIALLGEPELLVLDEPTVGLDPVLRELLWSLFARLADVGRTLLISSHVMDEAERCPELLLLREGKVLSHGSRQSLLKSTKTANVHQAFLKLAGGQA